MKKTTLFFFFAFLGFQFAAQAQTLEIVNLRSCDIFVDVNYNGGCFGTGTCTLPTAGVLKLLVPPGTSTYPSIAAAGAASFPPVIFSPPCSPSTYEYVRAGIQNGDKCACPGGGVTVGEPCLIATGFGPTCYTGCTPNPCAVMTRPFGPGSARITAY